MAIEITMPQLSDTMDEGTILNWLKKEGDSVSRGDALAEVATDKADLEIESFHEGVLLKIHSPQGTTVKVGTVIAVIGEEGEQAEASPPSRPAASPVVEKGKPESAGQPQASPQASTHGPAQPAPQVRPQGADDDSRVKISPLAKNLAGAYGVDYRTIGGSGDGGRIVKKDIERAVGRELSESEIAAAVAGSGDRQPAPAQQLPSRAEPQAAPTRPAAPQQPPAAQPAAQVSPADFFSGSSPAPAAAQPTATTVPLSKMRAAIASQMVTSTTTIPHFYVAGKIQADALERMRASLKPLPQYEGITVNHLIVKAVGLTLRTVPRINAAYTNGSLLQPQSINVGIITAVPDGLLIPVLKNADRLPLADIVADSRALVQRARSGRPKADDLQGATFCVSNMGKYDVENFTAIINPSQGAILAVSSIQEEAVVRDGQVVPANVLRVTLSVDHRIIDGVMAGEFITELKRLLEDPVLLLA